MTERMVLAMWIAHGVAGFAYLMWAGRRHIGEPCPRWLAVLAAPLFMATGPFPLAVTAALSWLAFGTVVPPEKVADPRTEPGRCDRCGWPLADSWEDGCVPGNCSMRPLPPKRMP